MSREFIKLCRTFEDLKQFAKQNPNIDANYTKIDGRYIVWTEVES